MNSGANVCGGHFTMDGKEVTLLLCLLALSATTWQATTDIKAEWQLASAPYVDTAANEEYNEKAAKFGRAARGTQIAIQAVPT